MAKMEYQDLVKKKKVKGLFIVEIAVSLFS